MDPGSVVNVNAIVWLIILVLLFVIEGMTYSLICIWFAGGALVSLILSLFNAHMLVQTTAFVVVAGLLLLLVRPVAVRMAAGRKVRTNADRVIGQEGLVIKRIDPISGEGQIKVMGQVWSAKPEDGKSIVEVDMRVEVMGITGVKAIVRPKEFQ
ncbi:MAG: NfeD family protein [Oscillospiraceae bacterium]|nr:NfeD family protein [Oscillospiraceae bacterium]